MSRLYVKALDPVTGRIQPELRARLLAAIPTPSNWAARITSLTIGHSRTNWLADEAAYAGMTPADQANWILAADSAELKPVWLRNTHHDTRRISAGCTFFHVANGIYRIDLLDQPERPAANNANAWAEFVATEAPPTEARIYFTTEHASTYPVIETTGSPVTITWHWSDDTTSSEAAPTKHFGSIAHRQHYLTVEPSSALTRFGGIWSNDTAGISEVSGLDKFENLNYLQFFANTSLTLLSIKDCHALRHLHLANTGTSSTVVDQWSIDLNDAVPGNVESSELFYDGSKVTSASATARASLIAKGWSIYPM